EALAERTDHAVEERELRRRNRGGGPRGGCIARVRRSASGRGRGLASESAETAEREGGEGLEENEGLERPERVEGFQEDLGVSGKRARDAGPDARAPPVPSCVRET